MHVSRTTLLAVGLVLAAPLTLVLNEFFGMPPAFTPKLDQPTPFAGVWTGPGVTLSILPGGHVFGVLGSDQVYRARIAGNRTWVGRALNWRTEYIIIGQVGEHRFTAPFNIREGRLDASFFIDNGQMKPGPAHVVLDRKS